MCIYIMADYDRIKVEYIDNDKRDGLVRRTFGN